MRWLRSTWGSRLLAAWLVLSLLPSVLVPAARAVQRGGCVSYAEWLRTQLRAPADAAVEAALATAAGGDARTLEAFLRAFVDAYEAQRPSAPLSEAFAAHSYSNDALVTYLQSRFQLVLTEGVLPRVQLVQALLSSSKTLVRFGQAAAFVPARVYETYVSRADADAVRFVPAVRLLRILSSARPLGP